MFARYFGLYIGQIYFTLYYLSYFCFLLYSLRLGSAYYLYITPKELALN